MSQYRKSKLIERYEDIYFEPEKMFNTNNPNNANAQIRNEIRFIVDNTEESVPLDWYNARFNVDFKLQKLADGANVANGDQNGMVNSSFAFIKKISIKMNGIDVYDCSEANQVTNIKNILEYSQSYAMNQATNEFYFIDTTRSAIHDKTNANYNKGFAIRKSFLNGGNTINTEIPLNRYGFFGSLLNELLPTSRIEINITIEDDNNLVFQATDNCRVIITKFQLIIPRIIFNSEGNTLYMKNYIKMEKREWTYLRILVEKSGSSTLQTNNFRISTGINKPRHVFVFIINDASDNSQTHNKFLYNTFRVANQNLTRCHLEVGNGKEYPEVHYKPNEEQTRIFRDALKYAHVNNEYQKSCLLNRANFREFILLFTLI